MDSTALIHSLARSGLSTPLTRQVVHWCDTDPTRSSPTVLENGWIQHVGEAAWQGYARYRQGLGRLTPRHGQPDADVVYERDTFIPGDSFTHDYVASILLRAIVAASVSGGQLDRKGIEDVMKRLGNDELSVEHRAMLLSEIRAPVSIQRLARLATDEPAAIMIYAASVMAVDTADASAMLYLTALADALDLDAALVAQLHRSVERDHDEQPLDWLYIARRLQRAVVR